MNSCSLAFTIAEQPQIRFSTDNQKIGEVLGEFYSPHHHEQEEPSPPGMLKIIAWGEKADMLNSLDIGSVCVAVGKLVTYSIDRPEGFKEKKVQLVAERLHPLS